MPAEPLQAFAPADYRAVLDQLAAQGYRPVRLDALRPDRRDLYLRHDVDLSLEHAAAMAELEAEAGVFSTYFVLVSTRLYNPASAASRRLLDRIAACGHEIGLHFDVTQVAPEEDVEAAAARECDLLAAICGREIATISFHRPAPELLGRPGRLAGRRHTYEPAFFSDIAYVSDSNGGWHHGHPLDHAAIAAGTAMQLLTHPIWWTGAGPREPIPLVRAFVGERQRQADDDVAGTISGYANWRAARRAGDPAAA